MSTGFPILLILLAAMLIVAVGVAVLLVWLYTRKRPEQRGFEVGHGNDFQTAALADEPETPRSTRP
jgi:hypothetical protein